MVDNGYELLLVSQFTLFGKLKGNKLEFVKVSCDCYYAGENERSLEHACFDIKRACCDINQSRGRQADLCPLVRAQAMPPAEVGGDPLHLADVNVVTVIKI